MKKRLIVILIILVLISGGAYFLGDFFRVKVDAGAVVASSDSRGIVERVGKIALLPEGEEPTVATINDLRPLIDKPFFKNAKVGYKLLIYERAGRGILYDPVKNKIIEMAAITLGKLPK